MRKKTSEWTWARWEPFLMIVATLGYAAILLATFIPQLLFLINKN